ncbi:cyclopropane-fatty-acyl-phospholipid synthase family protein [Conexibacter stalactiti]|uniref:Cyclopropane-fatty-acyl-phospholipid synthase family protein n=1 Tax=Conexibacter stalactiti TaxID=1940611 RepID=A0ABU4HT57_9ACTN|nr:cyclopropane-fatty-acyl-phospholipid synthase family protein [Conexibacter stalactiti]MDW5596502.1 cyclopropane-fatty-acyl-phospholipid synthase family protein [Conexibacter stalactiti]MEC5037144.1 cyclopropane-fatty-acyl-phospholipid synthase family protein [Conexibacter stalactiti]
MTPAQRAARAVAHALLRRVRGGEIELEEPGGRVTVFGTQAPQPEESLRARIVVRSPAFWTELVGGRGVGLGRAYMDGLWECGELVTLVRIAARAMVAGDRARERLLPLVGPVQRATWKLRANTRERSRERIAAHYDLGNELFGSFLDETMMYSCGIFERPDATLHEASVAKLERICRTLDLGPDDHVLEIGSGWGGFAIHAAGRHGCRVTTTTISRAQHDHAVAAVRAAGLQGRVTVLLQDYRDLRGRFDKLVSIEMIEAVGWEHLDTYFHICADRLKPDGAMLLQAIVTSDLTYRVERASVGFINAFIFPGGTLPSMAAIERSVGRTDLRSVRLEDISDHYVPTLAAWRRNFVAAWPELEGRGYDERFRRVWELYLAYCEAGFAERRIQDVQVVLAKPGFRREPLPSLPPLPDAVTFERPEDDALSGAASG